MATSVTDEFLQLINENLGIAHKISRIYFDDPESREDVRQEMMYQLWKSFRTFDGRSKFSTWMYSVCLNTALTYRRKTTREFKEPLGPGHEAIPDTDYNPGNEDMQLLYEGISTLSPLNKAIILLYMEDLPYDDIANITGLSKTNVSVRLVRLKRSLEIYIKEKSNQ
ncbi:MAG: sigma-70 family RNA polymerase sigma factor [Chryseolinea sp.]